MTTIKKQYENNELTQPLSADDRSELAEALDINFNKLADQNKILVVQVESSGFEGENLAKITLNGFQVVMNKNESNHYRGLHIVIINPDLGIIEFA